MSSARSPLLTPTTMCIGAIVACAALLAPLTGWIARRVGDDDARVTSALAAIAGIAWLTTLPAASSRSSTRALVLSFIVGSVVVGFGAVSGLDVVHAAGVVVLAAVFFVVVRGAWIGDALGGVVLLGLALPSRGDLDTFVGFPLRVLAADGAALLVSPLLGEIGSETVLMHEGRVADVEAACSGLSTLWVGLATALVIVWLVRRRPTSWTTTLLVLLTTLVTLMVMTTVRVAVLTIIALTPTSLDDAARATLGAVVHLPLGIIALVVAVAAGVLVGLRRTPMATMPRDDRAPDERFWPVTVAILAVGCLVVGVDGPSTSSASSTASTSMSAPSLAVWQGQLWSVVAGRSEPLTPAEAALYARHADLAIKWRADNERFGSILVVVARGTAAHHAPERCLASAGHQIAASFDVVDEHGAARVLLLDGGRAVGASFFASPALPAMTTVAGLGERYALDFAARARGLPSPPVVFVSAIWPRAAGHATALDDDERRHLALLRRTLARPFTLESR